MNRAELMKKVNASMHQQLWRRGYATPVDVLMDTVMEYFHITEAHGKFEL